MKAYFDNKRISGPFVFVHLIYYWLNSCLILHEKCEVLRWGVRLCEQVVSEVFNSAQGWRPVICQIVWLCVSYLCRGQMSLIIFISA